MNSVKLEQNLSERSNHFLLRKKQNVECTNGIYVTLSGKEYLSFSTNNYLGLTHHPSVIKAAQFALQEYGVGSGSSALVSGYTSLHQELEEQLADFLNYPSVLLFSSGYLANIGIISALFSKQDMIVADKLCHASLIDGSIASQGHFKRYPHRDMQKLEKICASHPSKNKLIISEGLFGMDGILAPLDKLKNIAEKNKACLMVDDAHGIGTLGKQGRGSLEIFNLGFNEVPILVGTLGKAFGTAGAFVASNKLVIENLIQLTRTYIYTTALPPAMVAAASVSLQIIQKESWRREKLKELIDYFKHCAKQLGINCESDSPIQPIFIGDNQRSLDISERLLTRGIFVKAIRPPTVPSARLRVTLTTMHTKKHLDKLFEALSDALKTC